MSVSKLHLELQNHAQGYLYNKNYWICGLEVPMPVGVCDAWGMKRTYGKDQTFETLAIEVKVSSS